MSIFVETGTQKEESAILKNPPTTSALNYEFSSKICAENTIF